MNRDQSGSAKTSSREDGSLVACRGEFVPLDRFGVGGVALSRLQVASSFHHPDRVCSCLHRHACARNISKPLIDRLRCGSETTPIDSVAIFVESAVMSPDISKVDADRHPATGPPAWNFCDKVMRHLFHGKQSPPSRTCSSHFSFLIVEVPASYQRNLLRDCHLTGSSPAFILSSASLMEGIGPIVIPDPEFHGPVAQSTSPSISSARP